MSWVLNRVSVVRFPATAGIVAASAAGCVQVGGRPSGTPTTHPQTTRIAAACLNARKYRLWIVAVDQFGHSSDNRYASLAVVISSQGEVVAQRVVEERLLVHDIVLDDPAREERPRGRASDSTGM